jgi:hypothetical protein
MTEHVIWSGKGPIYYEVLIDEDYQSESDDIWSHWKYSVNISAIGPYKDAYLGNDTEELTFLADTKEGAIRDLASFIDNQITKKKDREEMGLPPDPMTLNNVIIRDTTPGGDFRDINIQDIFKRAHELSMWVSNLPKGEKPYTAVITEYDDNYNVLVKSSMGCEVLEEVYNPTAYDQGFISNDVPKEDVIKEIRENLIYEQKDMPFPATIANTKIVNLTSNPEFTPARIFNTTAPLKLMQKKDSLHLIERARPSQQQIRAEAPRLETLSKGASVSEEKRKRLKA